MSASAPSRCLAPHSRSQKSALRADVSMHAPMTTCAASMIPDLQHGMLEVKEQPATLDGKLISA